MRFASGLALSVLLCSGPRAWGNDPARVAEHRPVRIFGIEHGLESLSFTQLFEDRRGLLWVAYEQSGVGIFDGARFHSLGMQDGLPSGLVTCLQEDSQGTLWAGTFSGLVRWDGRRFQKPDGPVETALIQALAPHPAGGMLAGTRTGLYGGGAGRPYTAVPGWEWGAVRALRLAPDGRTVWASSRSAEGDVRIHRWSGQTWTTFSSPGAFDGRPVDRLAVDRTGSVWASASGRLWRLPAGKAAFEAVHLKDLETGMLADLSVDAAGDVWVGTTSSVLHLRPDGVWDRIGSAEGLPARGYRALLRDRSGTLWLGGAGLVKLQGGRHLRIATSLDGLPGPGVYAFCRDGRGTLWVGTTSGLVRQVDGGWKRVPGTEDLVIRSIVQVPGGKLLVAGNASLLMQVDPVSGALERLAPPSVSAKGRFNRLAVAPDGTIYLATGFAGLMAAPPTSGRREFRPVSLPGGHPAENVSDLSVDATGRLWVAGDAGLALLEQGRWRRFTRFDGLVDPFPSYVRATRNGDILLAYLNPVGWSRHRLDAGQLCRVEHRHAGNGSQQTAWILDEDREGRVWAGGAKGLDILSSGSSEHVGQAHGLPSDDCNAQAFLAEPDGQVWIGTAEGIAHFRMREHPGLPASPRPFLLAAGQGDGSELPLSTEEPALPNRSTFTAILATVSHASEGQVVLEARIAGLEEAWTPVTDGRIRYRRLPSGRFELQFRSRIGAGPWSPTERFAFRVLPAWWETWWARSLGTAALLAGLMLILRVRTAVLTRRNRLLETLVSARTKQLEAAKDLAERASRFKSVFLATVSHELRTPLHAIRGFLDLMSRGQVQPRELPGMVRTMKGASDALLQLINDLLDLGAIESGVLELKPGPTDIRKVLDAAHTLLVSRIEDKPLLLFFEVDSDVPEMIELDERRFMQMVVNLVGNALKFTPAGHVRTRLEVENRGVRGLSLRFFVEDTGPGMPPDLLPNLFEPYRQGEGPLKGQGTGLGLSITRHLARHMGGDVGVSSTPGEGSRFWFTFRVPDLAPPPTEHPLSNRRVAFRLTQPGLRGPLISLVTSLGAAVSTAPVDLLITDDPGSGETAPGGVLLLAPPHAPGPLQARRIAHPIGARTLLEALEAEDIDQHPQDFSVLKGRVLLADDNAANRMLATSVMSALGLDCMPVESGEEAIAALAAAAFDIVLLDATMPGLDGPETLRRLRLDPRHAQVPIILFTASSQVDAQIAAGWGFDGLLTKPVDLEGTRRVLSRFLPLPEESATHWDRLEAVLGGSEGLHALAETFLEDGVRRMAALWSALGARDRGALEHLSHDFKSNAGHLGLDPLRQCASDLEAAAAHEDWPTLIQHLERLNAAWVEARDQVQLLVATGR